jgi:hypothetical protein
VRNNNHIVDDLRIDVEALRRTAERQRPLIASIEQDDEIKDASWEMPEFLVRDTMVGPTGPTGAQGEPGDDGEAATVTVGYTTTGEPGTNASVVNTGDDTAAVLVFTIPRGDPGTPGEPGTPGTAATVNVGTTTTGLPGSSAAVTNVGTEEAAILDFVIPRGDAGEPGAAATIAVGDTTTGEPSTPASVTNVGTEEAAVFDFVIPKGDAGEPGTPGADGADGADAPDPDSLVNDANFAKSIDVLVSGGLSAREIHGFKAGVEEDTSLARLLDVDTPDRTIYSVLARKEVAGERPETAFIRLGGLTGGGEVLPPEDRDPEGDDCDQNDHPGDGFEDDEAHPGEGDGEPPPGGGEADEDDDDHPAADDCYTST